MVIAGGTRENNMSTRCMIGVMDKEGYITAVYCHHDGYPQGVGRTLLENYNREKILEVIKCGPLDALGSTKENCLFYDEDVNDYSIYDNLEQFLNNGDDHDWHYYLDIDNNWHVIDMHWNDNTHQMYGKPEDDKLLKNVLFEIDQK